MRSDSANCKEDLLTEITSADYELYYAAYYSLERTKLTVAATHAEELSRLKKLRRDLAKLNRRRANLLQAANDEEMNATALKEVERSAKKLLECVKNLQQTAVFCEDSDFDKLNLAPDFASIQLHFKDLSLVTSDSGNVRKQLARLPIEAQTSKPIKQGPTPTDTSNGRGSSYTVSESGVMLSENSDTSAFAAVANANANPK
nr:unnamed protein product [Spirometra erinaceieuropaei]